MDMDVNLASVFKAYPSLLAIVVQLASAFDVRASSSGHILVKSLEGSADQGPHGGFVVAHT